MNPLQPWQDLYPGVGVCRHCGIAPGPVCGSYECNMRDNAEDESGCPWTCPDSRICPCSPVLVTEGDE